MKDIDDLILDCIEKEFKSAKEISDNLNIYYVRIAVRIKQLRKRGMIISTQSNNLHIKGVKPLKYKKKSIF